MKKAYSILFLISSFFVFGQIASDTIYIREVIDSLTSPYFSGRGYVEDGMNKAANYIESEFKKLGLKPVQETYVQEFTIPINVIKNAELSLNGKKLEYGIDFLVRPSSRSQTFHSKEIYYFDPFKFANSLNSETEFVQFIESDFIQQNGKHVVFPPHQFEVDSLNQYYKHWANFYRPVDNQNRAIFLFSKNKLIASLSQEREEISQFFIDEKFFSPNLIIDYYDVESEFIADFKVRNIIGKIQGENSDTAIVITAHYDHLGMVGNAHFPGANDNASGTAFLLSLAKYFSQNQPKYDLVFIAFGAEEAGILGAYHFVENPMIDLSKIKFLLNFDLMGNGQDGIQIVNSSIFTQQFELLNRINQENNLLKIIKKRGEACNSDHCPFYEKGVPSYFVYTLGGKGFYHDVYDTSESLSLTETDKIRQLFIEFINHL